MTQRKTKLMENGPVGPPLHLTSAVVWEITPEALGNALERHLAGDWGDYHADNAEVNALATRQGGKVIAQYTADSGVPFVVVSTFEATSPNSPAALVETRVLLKDEFLDDPAYAFSKRPEAHDWDAELVGC